MNELIVDLARRKHFESLDAGEKAQVLAEMNREEYNRLRQVLLAAPRLDDGVNPPDALRARILARAQPRASWYRARVPLWLVAAALALGLVAGNFMGRKQPLERTITVERLRVDTVWQEKVLWRDREGIRREIRNNTRPASTLPVRIDTVTVMPMAGTVASDSGSSGISLKDMPDLAGFFTR